jgi:hypothetical protein
MKATWIPVCLIAFLLASCASYEQNDTPPAFPYSPNSSSPCRAIKQQLNAVRSPEIGTRQTAIGKARLLREYEYYGCQG